MSLTPTEQAHVDSFSAKHKGWEVAIVEPRMSDEWYEDAPHVHRPLHPYTLGCVDTLRLIKKYKPASILDIASPLAQVIAMNLLAKVVSVDVRPLDDPRIGVEFVQGTATALPVEDGSVEFLTSLWVICHVGDGRYGDKLDPEGPTHMLQEVARVLRPGGIAVLGVGPVDPVPSIIFNIHRIFSWPWLMGEFARVGLEHIDLGEYAVEQDTFLEQSWSEKGPLVTAKTVGKYGIAVLRKKTNGHA